MRFVFILFMTLGIFGCGGSSTAETSAPIATNPEPNPEPSALDDELAIIIQQFGLASYPLPKESAPAASGPLFELGKELFFSRSLSRHFDVACASCHHPLLAGGDALSLPVGVDAVDPLLLGPGRTHDGNRVADVRANGGPNVARNSPTTFNLQF